jgi:hypothetical protein
MMRRRVNPGRLRAATIKAELARRGRGKPGTRRFESDPWTRRVVRPLLVAVLATALATGVLVIVSITSPDVSWFRLLPLCLLFALEGALTTAWLSNPDSHGVDKVAYRAAEVLVILIACRIWSWLVLGGGIPTVDDLQRYLQSPLEFFLHSGFFTTALVVLLAWSFAGWMNHLFDQLDISYYEWAFYTMPIADQKLQSDSQPIVTSRQSLQNQYLQGWLLGGMALVIMAALSTYEIGQLATVPSPLDITRLGLRPAMLIALLLYFLCGFWLLGQARLLRLNARWLIDGVSKEASLERDWRRNSLIVVGLIALAAAFIPIGSFPAISQILMAGVNAILWLAGAIFSLINFFIVSILSMFARSGEQQPPPELEPFAPPPPLAPPPASQPPSDTLTYFFSSAFWTFLIVMSVAALLFVFRERGIRLEWDRIQVGATSFRDWLRLAWLRLTRRLLLAGAAIRAALTPDEPGAEPPPQAAEPGRRFVRLGGLTPRQQVRYFYLSLVQRAAEVGIKRQDSETPLEYLDDLQRTWPEASDDLEELTDAFLEARYSARPVEPEDARSIKARWKRARATLRQRARESMGR